MNGVVNSGAFARNDTRRGAKQRRKSGSIRALGWLTAKITGAFGPTRSSPTISMRRKKTRARMRSRAVIVLLVILSAAKDLRIRRTRSFAVYAAQDDGASRNRAA